MEQIKKDSNVNCQMITGPIFQGVVNKILNDAYLVKITATPEDLSQFKGKVLQFKLTELSLAVETNSLIEEVKRIK